MPLSQISKNGPWLGLRVLPWIFFFKFNKKEVPNKLKCKKYGAIF